MDNSEKITEAEHIVKKCLLPALIQGRGIDTQPIESKHFEEFRKTQNVQLIYFFDFLQHYENILLNNEKETLEFRTKFCVLLCEQTATGAPFQIFSEHLLSNLEKLSSRWFLKLLRVDSTLHDNILKFYAGQLNANDWKRNLGSIYSFVNFCDLYYGAHDNQRMQNNAVEFTLSVAILYHEFYDPIYKTLAYRLFSIILDKSDKHFTSQMNIQSVIYKAIYEDIAKADEKTRINELWNCLCKCLKLMNISHFSKWSEVDDLIEAAIRRITYDSVTEHTIILFEKLTLIVISTIDSSKQDKGLEEVFSIDSFDVLRHKSFKWKDSSLTVTLRWAKTLLLLFISESYRLLGDATNLKERLLRVMHAAYISCILGIKPKIIGPHLNDFFHKFPSVLMEIVRDNKDKISTVQEIREFLKTFLLHLTPTEDVEVLDSSLTEFKYSFEEILKHNIFCESAG